jgi:CO/xanthine dehydrogenase Mo-binding subunit
MKTDPTTSPVGRSVPRIDAQGKVTGETHFPGDIDIDGQLWLAIRYSDRAHARVLGVDAARALALPGVHAVLTSADVPVNEYGLTKFDQPVLCGPGGDIAGSDVVRTYMDHVAVVVGETPEIAAAAAALVDVAYEDLPPVFDAEEALAPGAPQLHPDAPGNIVAHYRIRSGDMAAAWAAAEVIVEGTYQTHYQEHAYLQPEAGLGYTDDEGRVTIVVAGQWTHEDQEQICHALALPPEKVRVVYPAIGGAFGGREDMSVQIVLALAVLKTDRPVKTVWSREESIRGHHKRHPVKVTTRWGATRDGRVVAAEARVVGDGGAYNYTSNKVMANANLMVTGPYDIPNCHIDTYAVYTNNIPCGAFRGFGSPQALFAAEGQMNRLAETLGMDPVAIRLINTFHEGSYLSVGTPLPAGVSMPQVMEACARGGGWVQGDDGSWQRPPASNPPDGRKRRGTGVAMGYKNVGFSFGAPEHSWATIELHGGAEIEEVVLRQAAADVGQGNHTIVVQMAADAIGVPMEKVRLIASDTAQTDNAGSASASRLTFMTGNAIRGAAQLALERWQAENRPAIGVYRYRPPATTPYDPQTGKSEPNFAYGYVAQVVEIEVDVDTGQIEVLSVTNASDVGRAINPQQVQGQVEGAVVQAIGYTLMEQLISRDGKIINPYFSTYLIPTVLDIPLKVNSIILEYPDPIGPWGARGMGEMPFLTIPAAIAAAIHDATGVWMDTLPFTPENVVMALRQHGIGGI